MAWRCVWHCLSKLQHHNKSFLTPVKRASKRILKRWVGLPNQVPIESPNEDVGRRNKRCNADFRLTFQWFVAQIEYYRTWKVLRKLHIPNDVGLTFLNLRLGRSIGSHIWSKARDVLMISWKSWVSLGNVVHHMDSMTMSSSVANNKLRRFRPPLKERGWV